MNDALKQRLVGALVLLGAAFLFAYLLPSPGRIALEEGTRKATIDLHAPQDSVEVSDAARLTPPVIAAPAAGAAAGADSAETAAVAVGGEPDMDAAADKPAAASERVAAAAKAPPASTFRAPPLQLKSADRLHSLPPPAPAVVVAVEPKAAAKPATVPAAVAAEPKPVAKVAPPVASEPKPVAKAVPPPTAPVPPKMAAAASASPSPKVAEPPASVSVKSAAAPAVVATAPAPVAGAPAHWSVQIGSFSEVGNARQAESRIQAAGLPCTVALVNTPKGKLYRVRIAPLPGEPAAQAAKAKALQLGFAAAAVRQD